MKYVIKCTVLAAAFTSLFPALFACAQNLAEVTNLAPNPGFEEVTADGKALYFGGRHSISSADAHTGNYCIKQSYLPGNPWNAVASQVKIDVRPEQKYRFSVWCKNTVTAGDILFGIRFDKTIDGVLTGFTYSFSNVSMNASDWRRYVMTFTTPPETEAMVIYFLVGAGVNSGDVFWDDMTLEVVSQPLISFRPLPATVFFKNGSAFVKNAYFDSNSNSFLSVDPSAMNLTIFLLPGIAGCRLDTSMSRKYHGTTAWSKSHVVAENESEVEVPLGIGKLVPGVYTLKTDLVNQSGVTMESASKKITVLSNRSWFPAAEPVQTVEIDGDKNILVNGKAVFPVSVSHPDLKAGYLRIMRSNFGLNLSPVWCPGSNAEECITDIRKKLDLCLAEKYYGAVVLFHSWAFDGESRTWRHDALEKAVRALKDHPALLFWDLFDEPDGHDVPSAEVAKAYEFIKSIDPKHPIWVNLCFRDKFSEYVSYSDFASYDNYFFPKIPLLDIDDWNRRILESCGNGKPLISYLQTFSWPGFDLPSPEQLKAEVYLDLTRGMRIFSYYSWQEDGAMCKALNRDPELQSAVKEINYQLAVLRDFLLAPAGVQPSIAALNKIGDMRYIYKNTGVKRYLIVVNAGESGHNYAMELPGYRGSAVEAVFEDGRRVPVTNGILRDSVDGYGVHVYAY